MAALSAAQKPADASFVTISGMVKDKDSKKGIPGVSISLEGGKPDKIVAEAIKKIPVNYSPSRNLFTAFYRETVQKGKRYIGVSEAIVDVFKTPYTQRINNGERVQIKKGRRLISQNNRDTLAVK